MRASAEASRTGGFALVMLCTTAVIELLVIGFASAGFDEVADASPFGRPGTAIVFAVFAVVTLIATVVAWRGGVGAVRVITVSVLSIAVAIVVAMAMLFVTAGGITVGFAILLLLAAISMGMIARALLQPPGGSGR